MTIFNPAFADDFSSMDDDALQGALSCAHWLSWACGIDTHTAREKVRVARTLSELPLLSEALAKGELGYSKTRALTRIATSENEADLLNIGLHGTAQHVEKLVRLYRQAKRAEETERADAQHENRGLTFWHEDDGTVVLHGRFPPEMGARILSALDAAMAAHEDTGIVPVVDGPDGEPLSVGRRTRSIPPSVRRALASRDCGCRFPGCPATQRLHGHHVRHWADGGETSLDNLVLLCPTHHRLVHEGGFDVQRLDDGVFRFTNPYGLAIRPPTRHETSSPDTIIIENNSIGLAIDCETATAHWHGERIDYDHALMVAMASWDSGDTRPEAGPAVGRGLESVIGDIGGGGCRMRLFHYLEIRNFKRFGDRQRIELEHPTVLIGPNNCGKTTAIQAIALWSQAVKTWYGSKGNAPPRERTSTSLNRLNLVSVPVQRTRYFWHNTVVRKRNADIPLVITLGVLHENRVEPVTMRFRNQGEELIYCTPDEATLARPALIEAAARVNVDLLYPMSGLETEEPILQPGRIDVLLGQGQTAQTLRNLCLIVLRNAPGDWRKITVLTRRLFSVDLGEPRETARGAIDLFYRQPEVKEPLDIALAGRGLQQMLLIFAYLYSHRRSVLLIDEPDAHLEILRQKQVYVLLREIAHENGSQVILVTHSEVILEEALDRNLTLLLDGRADDLAAKTEIRNALKHYGTGHYVRARQRGYVLYVEGRTDLDILRALARRLDHPAADSWDDRINAFYVQDNFPGPDPQLDSEIERVEGGFGVTPREHFFALREMLPELCGLAILDSDRSQRTDTNRGGLRIKFWRRYEVENYFVTPTVLKQYARHAYSDLPLFVEPIASEIDEVLDALILERVFSGRAPDFATWQGLDAEAARLLWEASTERLKLSDFAEAFFRRVAERLGHAMLLRKGDLHQLVDFVDPRSIPAEVSETLDLLEALFDAAKPGEGA